MTELSCTGSTSCVCGLCMDAARERAKEARAKKIELRDVLDLLDRWIGQQGGLQKLRFSYETEYNQRVTILVESSRAKAVRP